MRRCLVLISPPQTCGPGRCSPCASDGTTAAAPGAGEPVDQADGLTVSTAPRTAKPAAAATAMRGATGTATPMALDPNGGHAGRRGRSGSWPLTPSLPGHMTLAVPTPGHWGQLLVRPDAET
jgi:hypothetical protein